MRGDYYDPQLTYNGEGLEHTFLPRRYWVNYQRTLNNLPQDLEVGFRVSRKGVPHLTIKRKDRPLTVSVTWFNKKHRRYLIVFWPYPDCHQTKAKGENGYEAAQIIQRVLNATEKTNFDYTADFDPVNDNPSLAYEEELVRDVDGPEKEKKNEH
jgi:hypothetical protein